MTSVLLQNDARKTSEVLALDFQQIQNAHSGHRCVVIARPALGTADTVAESKDARRHLETLTGRVSPTTSQGIFHPQCANTI
jgi:hypothetical protein